MSSRPKMASVYFHRPGWQLAILLFCLVSHGAAASEAARVTLLRAPNGGIQPQAAVDGSGAAHLIYYKGDAAGGDIFYVRRPPGQENFSKPIRVNTRAGSAMAIGTIRGAQLAVGKNGRVHVVWNGGKGAAPAIIDGKETTPLLYTRLNDAGSAFEPERNVITRAAGLDGGSSVAADAEGNVYITWHAPVPGNTNGEAGRAVFVAWSSDEGRAFSRETQAITEPTGACGCCGMKAFADSQGNVFVLYRAASEMVNRNETLLVSRNHGVGFEIAWSHGWKVGICPMSSAFLSGAGAGVLAAAETHGRVFFVRVDPKTGKASEPVSPETKAKHPVVISNARGEVLFVWTENTAWAKGGSVVWQVFDGAGNPISEKGRAEDVPVWSLATAFVKPDGDFVIVY